MSKADTAIVAERIRIAQLLVRWRRLVGRQRPVPMTDDSQIDLDIIERELAEAEKR